MTVFTILSYGLVNIILILLTGTLTGCSIAAGFDIWKKIKNKWGERKNKRYLESLEGTA
jgi:hypothetical protein